MQIPAGLQRGAIDPSSQGLNARKRSLCGRATGCGRGDGSTQQSLSRLHETGSNHVNVQGSPGTSQSQLGPTSTAGVARVPSGTPRVSATQRPAA